ncbi:cell wall hydrolase [Altererythrobacter sp. N1]|nr:cell wall hydrolase [Altererythrobacter sp. N1]
MKVGAVPCAAVKEFAIRQPATSARRKRRNRRPSRTAEWLRAFGGVFDGNHRGRRFLALAAAIAVPAMAAPGEWNRFDFDPASVQDAAPMPFETPGQSFPGSAFFYLQDVPDLPDGQSEDDLPPPLNTGAHWDGEPAPDATDAPGSRLVARPFTEIGSGISKARALRCLTMAVYYEAANESTDGQRAVAQVVLNRVAHPSYPDNVCGVVFQGSERQTGCQFTFTCDGSLNRQPMVVKWNRAAAVAQAALSGYVYRPIGLATHYHATYVLPYWASSLDNVGTIGLHTFYRWRGAAGRLAAFSDVYRGGEPIAAPHPRTAAPTPDSAPDPVMLARAYEAAHKPTDSLTASPAVASRAIAGAGTNSSAAPSPPPAYAQSVAARGGDRIYQANDLPNSSNVKAEYANSGRWIAQPN